MPLRRRIPAASNSRFVTTEVRFGWAEHPSFDAAIFAGGRVELDAGDVAVVPFGVGAFEDRAITTG